MWLSGVVTGTKVCCFCKPNWRDLSRSPKTTLATCGRATAAGYMGDTILEAWNTACRTDRGGLMSGKEYALLYGTTGTAPKGAGLGGGRGTRERLEASDLVFSVPPGGDAVGSPACFLTLELEGFGVARAFSPGPAQSEAYVNKYVS